jgi:hypothetical protein
MKLFEAIRLRAFRRPLKGFLKACKRFFETHLKAFKGLQRP